MRTPVEPSKPQPAPERQEAFAQPGHAAVHEPAWYLSSWELRTGLTVIEFEDGVTVPGDLA